MNELHLDYTKKGRLSSKRKRLLRISGIALMITSLVTLIIEITHKITLSLVIPTVANAFLGAVFILQSIEHRFLYPKKYINISTRAIEFKPGGFYREQRIEWDAINQISEGKNAIFLHSGDRVIRINMLHFPISDEKRIRSTISNIAKAKQL